MIEVFYDIENHGRTLTHRLTVSGHAGYAEKGKDIVCSAVSILTYTLANKLDEDRAEGLSADLSEGRSIIECEAPAKDLIIRNDFRQTLLGLELLEESYPQYVSIDTEY